ncbi:MAG: hypothetical protein WCV90_05430 [Candidatus Woesearchaeota archaeon]|jgi:hypothetical protein
MQKRGQLGIIEFKYFAIGVVIGIIIGAVLIYLSVKGIIPVSLKSTFCGVVGK